MIRLSSPTKRALIRLCYLLPAITGAALAIWAFIPHLFFKFNSIGKTQSPFTLICERWDGCQTILNGAEASGPAIAYSFTVSALIIISWIFLILYAIVAAAAAICSTVAFSYRPTEKEANRAKRWMQFFCANRVLYVSTLLLPLLPAAFPNILLACYRKQMLYDASLYFIGPSDLLLAAIFVTLNIASFLVLLKAQNEEHMDMFRLYKAK